MKNESESFSLFVGVDVSKSQLDVFLPDSKTRLTIDNSTDAIVRELVKVLKQKTRVLVVMEATGGYESTLVRVLGETQIAVAVVNPRQVRDFAKGIGKDAKTDAIDAEVIATFGQVVKPEPLAAKTEAEEKLAALVTRRSQLLDLINQETNRLQQTRDREEIAKLVGVAPINRYSGTWKGQRFVMGGRAHVRRVLYMATLVATRCNEKIRAHYLHLLARGKAKKLALVACMRKLLTILNTLLKNDVLWSNERSAPGSA